MTVTLSIEVPTDDNIISVELDCELSWENNGIGGYEFWGMKGYDKGEDYLVVDSEDWDRNKYTEEENTLIAKYVSDNFEDIEKLATEKGYKSRD